MVAEGGIADISAPVTIPLSCGVHGGSGRINPVPGGVPGHRCV